MTEKDELEMLREEKAFWFNRARCEHQRAELLAARVRELIGINENREETINKMANDRADDKNRFDLITDYCHASGKSGYVSAWNIGGITAEALRQEIDKAKAHKSPVVPVLDRVGYILTHNDGLFSAGDLFKPEEVMESLSKDVNVRCVYVVRDEAAKQVRIIPKCK